MQTKFAARTGIVTGGGRRGGSSQAIGRRLVNGGARVVLVDLDPAVVDFAAEIRASPAARDAGGDATAIVGNLIDSKTAQRAVEACIATFGRINFLVCVAGGSDPSVPTTCTETTLDHYRLLWDKNVATMENVVAAAAPPLKAGNGRRDIVTFSTVNASDGWPWAGEPALAAAKAAVEAMTRAWAAELRPFGVCVNCIRPASIPNPFSAVWGKRLQNPLVQARMRELYGARGPLTSEQVAVEVLHLLDPEGCPRTGQIVVLDPGGIGALGTESPRANGEWWLPAPLETGNNGNGRAWLARMATRLNTFIATLLP